MGRNGNKWRILFIIRKVKDDLIYMEFKPLVSQGQDRPSLIFRVKLLRVKRVPQSLDTFLHSLSTTLLRVPIAYSSTHIAVTRCPPIKTDESHVTMGVPLRNQWSYTTLQGSDVYFEFIFRVSAKRFPWVTAHLKVLICIKWGGTRVWTGDLSICSRMLYHWAIPPLVATGYTVWKLN